MASGGGTAREPGPGEREAMLLLMGRLDAGGDVNVRCPPVRQRPLRRHSTAGAVRGVGAACVLSGPGSCPRLPLWSFCLRAAPPARRRAVPAPRGCPDGASGAVRLTQRCFVRSQSGKTQLGGAACNSWLHLAKLLIERGAQVDATDAVRALPRGAAVAAGAEATPLRCAACAQDMNTPLHDAAAAGDAGICAMLLSAGAAVEARASVRGACGGAASNSLPALGLLGASSGARRMQRSRARRRARDAG